MQEVGSLVLRHLQLGCRHAPSVAARGGGGRPALSAFAREMSAPANQDGGCEDYSESAAAVRARVVDLVKKFDKIDADKVTEAADFQKDLSLDSSDRVELVMALEQDISIEISDERASTVVVDGSSSTPQVLGSTPSGSEFQAEVKKSPRLPHKPKHRP